MLTQLSTLMYIIYIYIFLTFIVKYNSIGSCFLLLPVQILLHTPCTDFSYNTTILLSLISSHKFIILLLKCKHILHTKGLKLSINYFPDNTTMFFSYHSISINDDLLLKVLRSYIWNLHASLISLPFHIL